MASSIRQNSIIVTFVAVTIVAVTTVAGDLHESSELVPCPEVCSCPNIPPALGLVCSSKNLTTIPAVNASAHFVDFSGNPLKVLTNQTLVPIHSAHNNLEILVLKACTIHSIDHNAFDKLENLRVIDLSSNGITILAFDVFTQLLHLSEINLSENNITNISGHWFAENIPLRVLNLTANPIKHLDGDIFTQLRTLEELRLDQCSLNHIDPHAFDSLFKLHTLNLSRNHLTTLAPDLMTWLRELNTLELSANPWQCDCDLQAVTVVLLMRGFQTLAGNLTCAITDEKISKWIDVNTTYPDCESQIRVHAHKTTLIGNSIHQRKKFARLQSARSRLSEPSALISSHITASTYSPVVTVSIWCAVIILLGVASYLGIYMTSKMCVYLTTKAAAAARHTTANNNCKKSVVRRESSDCERALVDETEQFRDHFYLVDEASSDISISIDV